MCKCPNYMIFDGMKPVVVGKKEVCLIPPNDPEGEPLPSDYTKVNVYSDKEYPSWRFVGHLSYDSCHGYDKSKLIQVPCGNCLECRLEQTRVWANRCVLESKYHEHNYFVTLTYDDEHLPRSDIGAPTLRYEDVQKFLKSLRGYMGDKKLRYLVGCEYGDKCNTPPLGRPHYHIILFGCELRDLNTNFKEAIDHQYDEKGNLKSVKFRAHQKPNDNNGLFYSKLIHKAWKYQGNISVGHFSYDTAAYIAQYCTKKINPKNVDEYEKWHCVPEQLHASTRPGIGADYFKDHPEDKVYWYDHIIVAGHGQSHVASVPRYFDKLTIKKYGRDKFEDKVKSRRLIRSEEALDTYLHSSINYDKLHEHIDYRLNKRQRLKTQI